MFFLGSGVSVEAGLFDADSLVTILCREIPDSTARDLQDAAQDYATIHSPVALKQLIRAELEAHLESEDALDRATLDLISGLPNCDFVTTNWDCLLEESFKPSAVNTIFLDSEVIYWSPEKRNILKMHGCMRSPSSIVVTRREYEAYRECHPNMVGKLESLFSEKVLVLCGYSLIDSTFREVYRNVASRLGLSKHPVYWIDPFAKRARIEDWRDQGVRFVKATARDFFHSLDRLLVGDEARLESSKSSLSIQTVLIDARRVLELEREFSVLKQTEIDEYEFFNSRFRQIRLAFDGFARSITQFVEDLEQSQLEKVREISEALYEVPLRISGLIDTHAHNITVTNRSAVKTLLRDLIDGAAKPLEQIRSALLARERILAGEPFELESDVPPVDPDVLERIKSLVSSSGFTEFSELIALLGSSSGQLVVFLSSKDTDAGLRREVFKRLWQYLDVVLLFENARGEWRRSPVLRSIMQTSEGRLKKKVATVLSLFSRDKASVADVESRLLLLSEEQDKSVALRCLVFHIYSTDIRRFATRKISDEALWTLVALEGFPLWALSDAAAYLVDMGGDDSAKLLIDIKYRDLEEILSDSLNVAEASSVVSFLALLKGSRVLFMDSYFERYAGLLRILDAKFGDRLGDEFRELNAGLSQQVDQLEQAWPPGERSFRRLPKHVKKKLASNMLYLHYLATSDDDELALLCKGLIRDSGFAASVMLSRQINTSLLSWIGRSRRLMTSYEACRNFLFNPRAQASVAAAYLSRLRPHDLERLRISHDVNGAIRQMAANVVRRRSKRG